MKDIKIYEVIGIDDLEGTVFAQCTTLEKAKKAKEITENNGFEDMLDIRKSNLPLNVIEIDGKTIVL